MSDGVAENFRTKLTQEQKNEAWKKAGTMIAIAEGYVKAGNADAGASYITGAQRRLMTVSPDLAQITIAFMWTRMKQEGSKELWAAIKGAD